MSPGGGVSVPAGAAPVGDDAAVDDEAPVADAACGAGVLAGPLLQATGAEPGGGQDQPAAWSRCWHFSWAGCYEHAGKRRRCAR